MRFIDLRDVEIRAKEILAQLKQKYPTLDAYLVYSSRLGQTEMGNSGKQMLVDFPLMFTDSPEKRKALGLLEKRRILERNKTDTKDIDAEIDLILQGLTIFEDIQLELRFGQLRYEVVWLLQSDELVDRARTPQTKASIRIVLGTIGEIGKAT